MITIREYARPATLEEAWQLNQKRPNRVLGGMLWLKMEKISVGTAIDLSALGLDTIEETDTEFAIGARATLRSLETHAALNAATNGAMREAVRHIVGVQFRNCATVGGSVYGRFGFSDVLTLLLALGCVCSSTLPSWLWAKISKNTAAKLIVFALLTVLCVCYVVAATNATALYANF